MWWPMKPAPPISATRRSLRSICTDALPDGCFQPIGNLHHVVGIQVRSHRQRDRAVADPRRNRPLITTIAVTLSVIGHERNGPRVVDAGAYPAFLETLDDRHAAVAKVL